MFNTGKFAGKTIVITGASRGIGREIALKLGQDGANIAIFAKTVKPHEKLAGTIYTVAEEVEKAGGKAFPVQVDIRDEVSVSDAVERTVKQFNGIDCLVNNASAISLTSTLDTPMKKYDLMHAVNVRGTFMMSQKCVPYLKQAKNPHILNLSPPLLMETHWFSNHVAYTMAKYGMSMCVLGMHEEFRSNGIAVNALWPKTAIWTAAMEMLSGGANQQSCRKPSIVADAAYVILSRNSRQFTGNFVIDEEILRDEGIRDFNQYAYDPNANLFPDFFVPNSENKSPLRENLREKSRQSIVDSEKSDIDVLARLRTIERLLTSEMVQSVKAIYQFNVKVGSELNTVFLDLKNQNGSIGKGEPPEPASTTMEMDASVFERIMKGDVSPTRAYITKDLKISGSMQKAMQLEALLTKILKSQSKI